MIEVERGTGRWWWRWRLSFIVDCWLLSITWFSSHMSHIWSTSKINWKLMYKHNNLDFKMEIFWPKTYKIVRLERLVETTKTGLCSVFKFLKWTWTEDRTAVTVLIGPGNFWSWSVLVQSGLGLFPVLRLDLQTLCSGILQLVIRSACKGWYWLIHLVHGLKKWMCQ